jgi:hypothetical protein
MSTLFLHDDALMHWTQEVKQAIETHRSVTNLKVPNTKYIEPNDYNINKQMDASIGTAQRDFSAARAVAKRQGLEVGDLTEEMWRRMQVEWGLEAWIRLSRRVIQTSWLERGVAR